jgi:LysM repeat protein
VDSIPDRGYESYKRSIEHPFEVGFPGSRAAQEVPFMTTFTLASPARVEAARPSVRHGQSIPDSRRAAPTSRIPVPTRLTARGRVVAVLLLVVAVFLLVSLGSRGASSAAGTSPTQAATAYITVQPGETLWQIAQRVAPQMDVRDAVDRLRQLNGLSTTTVQAGQRLLVPTGG